MAVLRTKGLVVKEVNVNDTDKIITLLTDEMGKISVSAKNARKSAGRYSYGTQILTYGEYVMFKGKGSFTLNGCDIIASFYNLAIDMERFTHAAHLIEMATDTASDSRTTSAVLNLLLHALNALNKGRNPQLVSSAFSMKLMQILGFPPHLTSCACCSTKEMEDIFFGFDQCGFICDNCARINSVGLIVEPGTAKALLHVLCSDNNTLFNFKLSSENLSAFSYITGRYVSERLEKKYNKLDFLKELDQLSSHLGGNSKL